MTPETFVELERLAASQGPAAAADKLIATLKDDKDFHALFDALLLKKKLSLGLPVIRPTSLDDVPDAQRAEFEKAYVAAAREVGQHLLDSGSLGQAWMYFKTIRDPAPVAKMIEALPEGRVEEEVIDIALFQGVAPARGLQMMLASHGTCSSITALDQQLGNMKPDQRQACAALMVRRLYEDLRQTLQNEVQRKVPMTPPNQSVKELIAGRDFLFADDNYHIDVSHLNSVVRFARGLAPAAPELKQAIQLAEYGARLSPQFQYAGEVPFQDYYPAHIQYFKALSSRGQEGMDYFRKQLGDNPHETDSQLAALAMMDLCLRLDKTDEALEIGEKYLVHAPDQLGFSFADLCADTGRFDVLQRVAKEKQDAITFTAALLAQKKAAAV